MKLLCSQRGRQSLGWLEVLLVVLTALHTLSLLSSSLVEEEHQTWYFYTTTLHTLILLLSLSRGAQQWAESTDSHQARDGDLPEDSCHNAGGAEYMELRPRRPLSQKTADQRIPAEKKSVDSSFWRTAFGLVVVLCILRVLRRWNQTGNKWLDVPDVGDWLVK